MKRGPVLKLYLISFVIRSSVYSCINHRSLLILYIFQNLYYLLLQCCIFKIYAIYKYCKFVVYSAKVISLVERYHHEKYVISRVDILYLVN